MRKTLSTIKSRILGILGILAVGYLLLLAMVQYTAASSHTHIQQVSSSLFPAALKMQKAEASFEQLKKRYKEAVLLEDATSLAAAGPLADEVATALTEVRSLVDPSSAVAQQCGDLLNRFRQHPRPLPENLRQSHRRRRQCQ